MPVIFCILGDAGTGDISQYKVANSLTTNIKGNKAQFVIGLGDNIYEAGCSSVNDKQFKHKFETPYKKIPNDIKFYQILGNHDYGDYSSFFYKSCAHTQIEYGIMSQENNMKWYLPYNYYKITKEKNGNKMDFFFIDTNIDIMPKKLMSKQLREINKMIRGSDSDWKILVGHHTFRSVAGHGNANKILELYLKKIMQNGIDVYMCGHDHTKQVIEYKLNDKTITCIVCGTGGKVYDYKLKLEEVEKDKKSALIWHKETLGFATAYCTPKKLKIEFYDEKNKLEYSHNIHKQKSNI